MMGYSREESLAALRQAHWNLDGALDNLENEGSNHGSVGSGEQDVFIL
jgi:hypothetical protein